MSEQQYDAIIIGAGVIGCAIAYELAKKDYKTLNVDKLPDAGFGSTSNSCAIVRAHYSTWDGVAMAYEGFFYWKDWENYIGVADERGYSRYMNTGTILLKTKGHDHTRVLKQYRDIGVEHEIWDNKTLEERMPIFTTASFHPPKLPEDPHFFDEPSDDIDGAIYTPGSGYVTEPQLASHNLMRAAEAYGGKFLFNRQVVDIRRDDARVHGITLQDGTRFDASVVVNVSGPHSFVINRMAGVEDGMNIKTRPLRHEVHHVHAPADFDFENGGYHTSDGDTGLYFRPEVGNTILVGSEDPECDPMVWIDDPDNYNTDLTEERWKAQVYRLAQRIPGLQIPNEPRGVTDLYDVSDDWLPVYDKSDLQGFYMAVGSSGNQFKNAPVAGYVMAELIDAIEKGHDHDNEPLKVKTVYTGLELNMGFYSRKRDINPSSSFSVNG